MQRIPYLLEKLSDISNSNHRLTEIDLDLMLDYTRVLYADLLEERKKVAPTNITTTLPNNSAENHDVQPKAKQEHTNANSVNDLRTIIGINDKYLFISELFNGDKTSYEDAIKELSNMSDKQQATGWIQNNLHTKYAWDSENDTVQSFYNLVDNSLS